MNDLILYIGDFLRHSFPYIPHALEPQHLRPKGTWRCINTDVIGLGTTAECCKNSV